ncbi:hypothetical protein ASG76_07550 [Nocardioides sp. Soil774]|uniref:hypothetical protein n=1 Tax=Nocardioides sp. Soil774 TaxID=1736408 RepID=UPI0006F50C61|nr:hypothetical protein [Nocardioides sp. Soil774]KRE95493.1 hypothetical protein ASG76_07550 [Nocardioides sp. Soil774]
MTQTLQARATYDEWRERRWRLVGLLLATMALATAALMITTGQRPATYADLLADVATSEVDEVQFVGSDGLGTVELRWTVLAGVLDQYAVVQVGDDRSYNAWGDTTFVTSDDPRETLRSINRSVRITVGPSGGTPSETFMEWRVPGPVALLAMATWLGVLLLIIGGPEPWRATRWAWGWALLLAGPLGGVAYLLLGGPLGVVRPHPGHRRLTGGWAFLLAWFVFAGWRETDGW